MISAQGAIGLDQLQHLSEASDGRAPDYLQAARDVLARLLASPALDRSVLARKSGDYARTLLFGDARISIFAFTWDVGSRTSIHDHHCSCCFGVFSGALEESWFRAMNTGNAIVTGQLTRRAGHIACMLPSGPNLHQVANEGDVEAVSLHVYGFDHRQHRSSVGHEYRVLTH